MFTGLIQDVGAVERVMTGGVTDVWISPSAPLEKLALGESIACEGVCLTVVEVAGGRFRVQASPETLRRTTLGDWRAGTSVNLERAMQLSDRLGGHLMSGHVDAVGQILGRTAEGGTVVMSFSLPPSLGPLFIEKGSVAIDGISLTINALSPGSFSVALIPETQARTTLAQKAVGQKVNLEADLIGKYVARWQELRGQGGLSEELVRRSGFGGR